jgi:hypothetical protein
MSGYSIEVQVGDQVRAAHMVGDTTSRALYKVTSVEVTLVKALCLEGDNPGSTIQVGAYEGRLHSHYWEKVLMVGEGLVGPPVGGGVGGLPEGG